eukprot:10396611-Heterocapsa_arctica.AAC.1
MCLSQAFTSLPAGQGGRLAGQRAAARNARLPAQTTAAWGRLRLAETRARERATACCRQHWHS